MGIADETTEVRPAHRFEIEPLSEWMERNVAGFRRPLQVRQFAGGQSNPTFLLDAGGEHFVLRKKPPGKLLPSAHQVDREYRVMRSLAGTGVPVPNVMTIAESEMGNAGPPGKTR